MVAQVVQRHLRQCAALVEIEAGVQLHQVQIARLVLRQQHHRRRARGFSPGAGGIIGQRDLTADDRLQARGRGVTENSSAANMLLVSVTATAGISAARRRDRAAS